MARTPVETLQPNTEINPVQEKNVNELVEAGQQVSIAQAAVMDSFDVVKAIGRIEAANFFTTVGDKLIAETAVNIKNGKKYIGLPYKDAEGNHRHVGDFDEFCRAFLGKSSNRVNDLVRNYNMLGPDLYEQAEKIGFRQRDYNALKALPSDDRLLIAQAIEEENLDKALDLMQEMAAKHFRDKESLTKQCDELTKTLEAREIVIKDKASEIFTKDEKIAMLVAEKKRKALEPVSLDQSLIDARTNLQNYSGNIKAQVMTQLRACVKALHQIPGDHKAFTAGCLAEISRELVILRDEYSIPAEVSEDLTPEWMKPGWEAELQKEYAQGLPSVHDVLTGE